MFTQYIVYAVGAALLAAVIWGGIQTSRLSHCQTALKESQTLVIQYQEAVKQRDATLSMYAKMGQEQNDRLVEAERLAEASRVKADNLMRKLSAAPVPQDTGKQTEYLYTLGNQLNHFWVTGEIPE